MAWRVLKYSRGSWRVLTLSISLGDVFQNNGLVMCSGGRFHRPHPRERPRGRGGPADDEMGASFPRRGGARRGEAGQVLAQAPRECFWGVVNKKANRVLASKTKPLRYSFWAVANKRTGFFASTAEHLLPPRAMTMQLPRLTAMQTMAMDATPARQ